jgi:hypothetical protein
LETRRLSDGSVFCYDKRGACHLIEVGSGVVLHVGHGMSMPELARPVIEHGKAALAKYGRCVIMVDGSETKMMATEFREAMTEWYKTKPNVTTHILIRSKLLAMAINIANLVTRGHAAKVYTDVNEWVAAGRRAHPTFARRPFAVPDEVRDLYSVTG